jgi:hypothetical protein
MMRPTPAAGSPKRPGDVSSRSRRSRSPTSRPASAACPRAATPRSSCCALDGSGDGVRTRETIETVGGALVVSAGATVVAAGEDGAPRPLTDLEREALSR